MLGSIELTLDNSDIENMLVINEQMTADWWGWGINGRFGDKDYFHE